MARLVLPLFLSPSHAEASWQNHSGSDCDGVDMEVQPTAGLPSLAECPKAIDGFCAHGHMSNACVAKLQAVCDATPGCAGFNTDRVFKTAECSQRVVALPARETCVDLYLRDDLPPAPPPLGHVPLWPLPASLSYGSGRVALARGGAFRFEASSDSGCGGAQSPLLSRALERFTRLLTPAADATADVVLPGISVCVASADETLGPLTNESYSLHVPDDGSRGAIVAASVFGAMRAMETFVQLISLRYTMEFGGQTPPPGVQSNASFKQGLITIAPVRIDDAPRFSYRGLMIDTSRHFLPVAFLKHIVDGLAQLKLNVLHWHIIDTEAFPAGSDAHPELAALGAWDASTIYSPADMREIVAYALDRGVRVVPEFDMPGHGAWGKAHPELMASPTAIEFDPTNEELYPFLRSFLEEMVGIFPDAYLHLGGDEVALHDWSINEKIQAWLKQHNMTTGELEPYFWQRMRSEVLPHLNRTLSVWEDNRMHIDLSALPEGAVVNAYETLGSAKTVISRGVRAVVSIANSHWYLDSECGGYNQIAWKCIYNVDPGSATAGLNASAAALLLGGETAMWAEGINRDNFDAFVWRGTAAAAERLWSPLEPTRSATGDTTMRLAGHICRMRRFGIKAGPVDRGYCPEDVAEESQGSLLEEVERLKAELAKLAVV